MSEHEAIEGDKQARKLLLAQKEANDYQTGYVDEYSEEELATKLAASRVLIAGALRDHKIPAELVPWVKRLLDKNNSEDVLGLADLIKKGVF